MHAPSRIALFVVIALAPARASASHGSDGDKGLRFNSPGVLDLAERSQKIADGNAVPVAELPGADAEAIFAAPAIGENEPLLRFSDDEFGCLKASRQCLMQHERALLGTSGSAVKRDGTRLTVVPKEGPALVFVDWKQPATKTADGDEETHWYLGRTPKSGYERVEVQFGHDAPGNFLVNLQSGKVAFVHNGADVVAPSPDGKLAVTFNSLNPPISIRVAQLDAAGPRLVLQCEAREGQARLTPVFKGWQNAAAFGLVFEIGEQSKSMARLAIAVSQADGHWTIAPSDAARLAAIGFACREVAAR